MIHTGTLVLLIDAQTYIWWNHVVLRNPDQDDPGQLQYGPVRRTHPPAGDEGQRHHTRHRPAERPDLPARALQEERDHDRTRWERISSERLLTCSSRVQLFTVCSLPDKDYFLIVIQNPSDWSGTSGTSHVSTSPPPTFFFASVSTAASESWTRRLCLFCHIPRRCLFIVQRLRWVTPCLFVRNEYEYDSTSLLVCFFPPQTVWASSSRQTTTVPANRNVLVSVDTK